MPWTRVEPVVDPSVRGLCTRRYPGHPRGCPNHNKKPGCPPSAPLLSETLDLTRPLWAVYNIFDLGAHVARMRDKHPEWSDRQLACCLYWQPKARKQLRNVITHHHSWWMKQPSFRGVLRVIACPEAQGVNLTATMASAGIFLEWPPQQVAYQIVLAGSIASPFVSTADHRRVLAGTAARQKESDRDHDQV